jgi:uncharacterized membrane protein YeaQ/YmgE (transglycosylase-associated protein family)
MLATNIMEFAGQWADTVLMWIGFGTVVGLVAKAIMPGRDPGGALATVILGITGSVVGCGVLAFSVKGAEVRSISPLGFLVATAGAFFLLFMYRLLSGRIIRESGTMPELHQGHKGRRIVMTERQ